MTGSPAKAVRHGQTAPSMKAARLSRTLSSRPWHQPMLPKITNACNAGPETLYRPGFRCTGSLEEIADRLWGGFHRLRTPRPEILQREPKSRTLILHLRDQARGFALVQGL